MSRMRNFGRYSCVKRDEMKLCNLITEYHEGLLSSNQRREFESHLGTCQTCQQNLKALQALSENLSSNSLVALSSDSRARIIKRFEEKLGESSQKRSLSWKIAYAFSLALVCALVLVVFPFTGNPAPPPEPAEKMALTAETQQSPFTDLAPRSERLVAPAVAGFSHFVGARYLKVSADTLESLTSQLPPEFLAQDDTRIYVLQDQYIGLLDESIKAASDIKILSPLIPKVALPPGQSILILEEARQGQGAVADLFFHAWKSEMQKSLFSWFIVPVLLSFLFLGLFFWRKSKVFALLFCIFLLFAILLPTFRPVSQDTYLYLGTGLSNFAQEEVLAQEKTNQFVRLFVSQEMGKNVIANGFFITLSPIDLPKALQDFDWGQGNSTQILYFNNWVIVALLVVTIFLSKAVIYFLPLALLATASSASGRAKASKSQ